MRLSRNHQPDTSARAQEQLHSFIEHRYVQHGLIALIILNAIILGVETSSSIMAEYGPVLLGLDKMILGIFVLEIVIRIYVYRRQFWRDPWSIFDFSVVAIALVPASGEFAVLRTLRVLRVLRLLTIVPSMRKVVGALLSAIPGLGSIGLVLLVIYYVFAVIATNLFSSAFPEWFGTLGNSLYTLFQIMTLESWSMGIARPVMQQFPHAWLFFVVFILVATFTMLNLFIAIIVNAMDTYQHEHEAEPSPPLSAEDEVKLLRQEVQQMNHELLQIKTLIRENLSTSAKSRYSRVSK